MTGFSHHRKIFILDTNRDCYQSIPGPWALQNILVISFKVVPLDICSSRAALQRQSRPQHGTPFLVSAFLCPGFVTALVHLRDSKVASRSQRLHQILSTTTLVTATKMRLWSCLSFDQFGGMGFPLCPSLRLSTLVGQVWSVSPPSEPWGPQGWMATKALLGSGAETTHVTQVELFGGEKIKQQQQRRNHTEALQKLREEIWY